MSTKRTAVNLSPSFIKTMVFECTGTNDLILTSMTNRVTNLKRGLILIFEMSETNTGTVTAKVSDVPTPASLVGADGKPLSPGELKKGNIYQFFYTGTVFKMIYSDVILEEGEGMRIEKKPDGTYVIGTTIVDTWRPVTDALNSDSSSTSLSAKAGKTLKQAVDDRYTKKEADEKFVERENGRVLIGSQNLDFSMKAPTGYSGPKGPSPSPRVGGYNGGVNPHGNVNITEDGLDIKSNYSVNVVINKDDSGEAFYRLYTGSGRKRLLEIGESTFTYGPQNYKVYHEGFEPSWNKLKDKPDLAAKVHNHDDRYYTETEMDSKLATKLDKSAKAVDSSKLEGKTKAQVVTEARVGLATKAQLDTAIAESAYGIKYSVANEAERIAIKGMIATEQCVQKDNRIVYRWSGHSWDQFYKLDGVHNHNDSYYTKSEMNTKLDGKVNNDRVLTNVPRGALFTDTVYKHPTTHPATMITESSAKRFVTDAEKKTWNDNVSSLNGNKVAIGADAGNVNQGNYGVAVGKAAGYSNQGSSAVAIGNATANDDQGSEAVAIGNGSGNQYQGIAGIAIGNGAGKNYQGTKSIAIGERSGETEQGTKSIAIGINSAVGGQGESSVAIGPSAGYSNQGSYSVAIGSGVANNNQGAFAIALGYGSGNQGQGDAGVAIGNGAGKNYQGAKGIAIGEAAGETEQGVNAIAIGNKAGLSGQGAGSIAIGTNMAATKEGEIKIGTAKAVLSYDPMSNKWNLSNSTNNAVLTLNGVNMATTTYGYSKAESDGRFLGKSAKSVDSSKLEGKTKAQVVAEARSGLAATTYAYSKAESDGRFLGKSAKSVDSSKLEGKTKAQVVAEARSGLAATTYAYSKAESDGRFLGKTAKSVDSAKLEGKTKAQVVAEARSGYVANATLNARILDSSGHWVSGSSRWFRAGSTATGFLPFSNGQSSVGTSSWLFKEMWAANYRGTNVNVTGTIRGAKSYNAVYNDYAELFETPMKEKGMMFEPGDIVMLDLESDSDVDTYVICREENSVLAVGVVSDDFAQLIGGRDTDADKDFEKENKKDHAPIGLMGRVRPKIAGPITKGDFVVSSHILGAGRRYVEGQDNPLSIIGVAVRTKSSPGIERVRMLIKR